MLGLNDNTQKLALHQQVLIADDRKAQEGTTEQKSTLIKINKIEAHRENKMKKKKDYQTLIEKDLRYV